LQKNKISIFEREGWQNQPSLSKMGILLIRRALGTVFVPEEDGRIMNFLLEKSENSVKTAIAIEKMTSIKED